MCFQLSQMNNGAVTSSQPLIRVILFRHCSCCSGILLTQRGEMTRMTFHIISDFFLHFVIKFQHFVFVISHARGKSSTVCAYKYLRNNFCQCMRFDTRNKCCLSDIFYSSQLFCMALFSDDGKSFLFTFLIILPTSRYLFHTWTHVCRNELQNDCNM